MSRSLFALALALFAAPVLLASSSADAQPDRYLFVPPGPEPCCELPRPIVRPIVRPVVVQPRPIVRRVERRVYVTPPPPVQLRRSQPQDQRFLISLALGTRRPVWQSDQRAGVVTGVRLSGDFGWLAFGVRFDFSHFADEDEYRTGLEWRFIARRHEMFRPYASFTPHFTAVATANGTRFGFGVESELGLAMNHELTHGALRISLGATGAAAYLPEVRSSRIDVGVRATIGFAFNSAD